MKKHKPSFLEQNADPDCEICLGTGGFTEEISPDHWVEKACLCVLENLQDKEMQNE